MDTNVIDVRRRELIDEGDAFFEQSFWNSALKCYSAAMVMRRDYETVALIGLVFAKMADAIEPGNELKRAYFNQSYAYLEEAVSKAGCTVHIHNAFKIVSTVASELAKNQPAVANTPPAPSQLAVAKRPLAVSKMITRAVFATASGRHLVKPVPPAGLARRPSPKPPAKKMPPVPNRFPTAVSKEAPASAKVSETSPLSAPAENLFSVDRCFL